MVQGFWFPLQGSACLIIIQLQVIEIATDGNLASGKREFFVDNLLIRVQFIIEMIWWTGLAPWEFKLPFFRLICTERMFAPLYKTVCPSEGWWYAEVAVRQGAVSLQERLDAAVAEAPQVPRPQPRDIQPGIGVLVCTYHKKNSRAFRCSSAGGVTYEAKSALSLSRSTPFSPNIRTSTDRRAPPSRCNVFSSGGCGKEHLKRVLVIPPNTCSTVTESAEQFGTMSGRMRRAEPPGSAGSNSASMFGHVR